ncbi:hypothetical protein [Mariniphaga sediminis]|uniref:hypothetical protein n=1 Tax=Mariniphaga sediminis TaxID=1628158 RepID=UPI0035675EA6
MITIKDTDFYKRESEEQFSKEELITFKHPEPSTYEVREYDWYILIAIEKAEKVKENRHLLTRDLLLSYRWAIREGFNHMLDPHLKNRWDAPRNRNTIEGIMGYIARIKKASDKEMENLNS